LGRKVFVSRRSIIRVRWSHALDQRSHRHLPSAAAMLQPSRLGRWRRSVDLSIPAPPATAVALRTHAAF
jgi:hypothetical protein